MTATVGAIQISLQTDAQRLVADFGKAGTAAESFGRRVDRPLTVLQAKVAQVRASLMTLPMGFAGLSRLAGSFSGLLGISFGTTALISGIKEAISSVAELGDTADRVGVSAEKLQVLRQALTLSGGAAADADSAFEKLNVRIGQLAQAGTGPAADAMKALGINVRDAGGAIKSNDVIFDEAIKRLSAIENGAQRSALASDLFGKEVGPKMAALAAQGVQGLADVESGMRRLGSLMSNESVKAAQAIDDKFAEIANTLAQKFKGAVVNAAEAVYYLIDSFRAVENQTALSNLNKELDANTAALDRLEDAREQLRVTHEAMGMSVPAIMSADIDRQITELFHLRDKILNRIGELNQASTTPKPSFTPPASTSPNQPSVPTIVGPIDIRPQIADTTAGIRELGAAMQETADTTRSFFGDLASGLRQGKSWADSLTDAIGNLGQRLLDMALDRGVQSLFGSLSGAGGLFNFGGAAAGPAFGSGLSTFAGVYHGGGTVGAAGTRRRVSPMAFMGAPRFHDGLRSNERRGIFLKGEEILTRRMAEREANTVAGLSRLAASGAGGGGAVKVQVINNTGAPVRQERSRENGMDVHRIIVGEMNKAIAKGSMDRVMRETYGVGRKGRF